MKTLFFVLLFYTLTFAQVNVYELHWNVPSEQSGDYPIVMYRIYLETRSTAENFVLQDSIDVKGTHPTDSVGVDIGGYEIDSVTADGSLNYVYELVENEDNRYIVGGVVAVNSIGQVGRLGASEPFRKGVPDFDLKPSGVRINIKGQ